jgi:hypothetical protein
MKTTTTERTALLYKMRTEPISYDLSGPEGNAFHIINLANKLAVKLGYEPDERGKLSTDLMSGDYDHLLETFELHFGDFVTFVNK